MTIRRSFSPPRAWRLRADATRPASSSSGWRRNCACGCTSCVPPNWGSARSAPRCGPSLIVLARAGWIRSSRASPPQIAFPPMCARSCYQVAREALANIVRPRSRHARRDSYRARRRSRAPHCQRHGRGIEPGARTAGGMGLGGLAERLGVSGRRDAHRVEPWDDPAGGRDSIGVAAWRWAPSASASSSPTTIGCSRGVAPRARAQCDVVGEAASGEEAVALAIRTRPQDRAAGRRDAGGRRPQRGASPGQGSAVLQRSLS